MRLLPAALIPALLVGPAYAQAPPPPQIPTAQEQVANTIGSLFMQKLALEEQVQRLQADLAKERAARAPEGQKK